MFGDMSLGKKIGLGALALFVLIQFFQIDRNNPEITAEMPATDEVRTILEESCYDCHSNETDWPWYSYVAPVSWLVGYDVNHAKEYLNMSEWDSYTADDKAHLYEEFVEVLEEGEMPLWYYEVVHQSAKLSESETETIISWAESQSQSAEAGGSHDHSDHEH